MLTITQDCKIYLPVFDIDISASRQQHLHNIFMSKLCCRVQCCLALHEMYKQMQQYTSELLRYRGRLHTICVGGRGPPHIAPVVRSDVRDVDIQKQGMGRALTKIDRGHQASQCHRTQLTHNQHWTSFSHSAADAFASTPYKVRAPQAPTSLRWKSSLRCSRKILAAKQVLAVQLSELNSKVVEAATGLIVMRMLANAMSSIESLSDCSGAGAVDLTLRQHIKQQVNI